MNKPFAQAVVGEVPIYSDNGKFGFHFFNNGFDAARDSYFGSRKNIVAGVGLNTLLNWRPDPSN